MKPAIFIGIGLALSSAAHAQTLPAPFADMAHVTCIDSARAIELLTLYEHQTEMAEAVLERLAVHGICRRETFSGRPTADLYPTDPPPPGKLRTLHIYEVEVTKGYVLNGRSKVYILLQVEDNQT